MRKRKEAQRSKTIWGVVLICFVICVLLAGLFGAAYLKNSNDAPKNTTVALLDVTSPLTLQEKKQVMNYFEELVLASPNTNFSVFKVLDVSNELLAPLVRAASPAQNPEAAGWLTTNPKQLKLLWEREFKRPLTASLEQTLEGSPSQRSPIMESIQSVALTDLLSPTAKAHPRKLIVVSDFLQHTDEFSFYRTIPAFSSLANDPNYAKLKTNLAGVEVELWVLRNHTKDATKLADLWRQIISDQSGNVSKIVPIP